MYDPPFLELFAVATGVDMRVEGLEIGDCRLSGNVATGVDMRVEGQLALLKAQRSELQPAWICGLKGIFQYPLRKCIQLQPAWICGLKVSSPDYRKVEVKLQPAWICGLKEIRNAYDTYHVIVATGVDMRVEG